MALGKHKFVELHRGGFTVLELVITISLLVILSTAAMVGISVTGTEIDSVSKILRSNIQYAQDMAMTNGSSYGMRSIDSTSYEIFDGTPGTPAVSPLTNNDLVVDMSPVQFFGSVTTITFDSNGIPDNSANETIQLTEGDHSRTLTVSSDTGVVDLSNP
ncbi:MAG: prepilin-type N-terminal cleavage/methylation domain-containing protein [Deltaproteobacteria bacterium]|jgi:prepilin-type N-terminal cleavage/methylation domain-containing protein|nr:prepilin-type N-terminal cleavage/methylation domain-containing protein [Deltaproteobacteria bacterium]